MRLFSWTKNHIMRGLDVSEYRKSVCFDVMRCVKYLVSMEKLQATYFLLSTNKKLDEIFFFREIFVPILDTYLTFKEIDRRCSK